MTGFLIAEMLKCLFFKQLGICLHCISSSSLLSSKFWSVITHFLLLSICFTLSNSAACLRVNLDPSFLSITSNTGFASPERPLGLVLEQSEYFLQWCSRSKRIPTVFCLYCSLRWNQKSSQEHKCIQIMTCLLSNYYSETYFNRER